MFGTRRTGPVHTSVRLHPVKLLMFGLALCVIGAAMLNSLNVLWIVLGVGTIVSGFWIVYIAVRQMVRGARTFLS